MVVMEGTNNQWGISPPDINTNRLGEQPRRCQPFLSQDRKELAELALKQELPIELLSQ